MRAIQIQDTGALGGLPCRGLTRRVHRQRARHRFNPQVNKPGGISHNDRGDTDFRDRVSERRTQQQGSLARKRIHISDGRHRADTLPRCRKPTC